MAAKKRDTTPPPAPEGGGEKGAAVVEQLQAELAAARAELRTAVEKLEQANQELRVSNEEIATINEELRSSNEELAAVNAQLREKVGEPSRANDDLANLLECTDVATVFLDAGLCVKMFTPAATRLFHLSPSDVGRPISDVTRKFGDPELIADALAVLRRLAPRENEVSAADGSWWARRVTPYRSRDRRAKGVVITLADITERKRAADAVVRRLAAVVENSADSIYSKDLDGTIRTWNAGAERLYGYSHEEAVGRPIAMLFPEDRAEELAWIMERLRRGQSVVQLETERLRKDGQRVQVSVTASPVRDGSGQVVSASVIGRDVSERKRAEQALRDSEERLRAILGTVADAVITIDCGGIIQSVNVAAERMFGYAAAEMLGQNVTLLMAAPHREAHDGYMARYLQTREKHLIGVTREAEARRKDGSVFPTDLSVSEIEHLKLFTGVHRDLTRRRQLERDVVEAASREQRRIGQDLHDTVGQELTALNLLAADLAEALRTNPANGAAPLARITEGLRRSQSALRTVLRGLLPVAVEREGLMAALADLADRTTQDGKVSCTFDCPVPVEVADNVVATQLYLIAQEAVHNALKHGRPSTVRIRLESNLHLVLSVRCDGVGMPPQPPEGQGLGLRIMRNRAAIIGASLTIGPAEPTGTLVTCALMGLGNDQKATRETGPRADRG